MRYIFLGEKVRVFSVNGTSIELHPKGIVGGAVGETLVRSFPILFRPVAEPVHPHVIKAKSCG